MEIWQAEPGDIVRLPASCYPRVVTVTGSEYAPDGCNRIHWEADQAHGSTVLLGTLQVSLLHTARADKQAFLAPQPEPEAEP
jgi:hypothetical protein